MKKILLIAKVDNKNQIIIEWRYLLWKISSNDLLTDNSIEIPEWYICEWEIKNKKWVIYSDFIIN